MSGLMSDVGGLYGTHQTAGGKEVTIAKKGSNLDLDMTDFITLMITQLTSQGIDDTMDTSEMLNQMVQMQMITSMVNMTDAVTMNYSASLVGKFVTVGKLGDDGKLEELYGEVTGTGTIDGQQVIFLDNKEYYYLSEIMAVGKLPPKEEEDDKVEGEDGVEGGDKPDGTTPPEGTKPPDETEPPDGTVPPSGETGNTENGGESGPTTDSEG